jgi:glycosyltransferase involved in cell wall biosynthesis
MILYINGRFLTQRLSGVQQFGIEICKELIAKYELKILVPAKSQLQTKEFKEELLPIGRLTGHFWEQLELPYFMKSQKNALLLNLCNTAPLFCKKQFITIHDLAFAVQPSWFDWRFSLFYNFLIPRIIRKSNYIFTVSETIKQEIISTFKIGSEKISILGNKVSDKLLNSSAIKPNNLEFRSQSFYLMVGSSNPRKNFTFVEELFKSDLSNFKLVVVGGSHAAFKANETIKSDNIIYLDFVKVGELKWLYENALALINPSVYEGFGIPNLEALAFKTLVFCTNIPVFKEIYKDSVCYFELNEKQSLKALIMQHQNNPMSFNIFEPRGGAIFNAFQNQNRATEIINVIDK